jgi:hypothetical protein
LSHTTWYRFESGQDELSLRSIEIVMNKLKIRLSDIFPDEY